MNSTILLKTFFFGAEDQTTILLKIEKYCLVTKQKLGRSKFIFQVLCSSVDILSLIVYDFIPEKTSDGRKERRTTPQKVKYFYNEHLNKHSVLRSYHGGPSGI